MTAREGFTILWLLFPQKTHFSTTHLVVDFEGNIRNEYRCFVSSPRLPSGCEGTIMRDSMEDAISELLSLIEGKGVLDHQGIS